MWSISKISNAYTVKHLNDNVSKQEKIVSDISSGVKIKRASDDVAGMKITESMETLTGSNEVGRKNIENALSLIEIADGGLSIMSNQIQRINELMIYAQNGTYSNSDLDSFQQEVDKILESMNMVANRTRYKDLNLLTQNDTRIIRTGGNVQDTMTVSLVDVQINTLGLNSLDVRDQNSLVRVKDALNVIAGIRSEYGAKMNTLEARMSGNVSYSNSLEKATSVIKDTDMAEKISENARNKIIGESAIKMVKMSNDNTNMVKLLLNI